MAQDILAALIFVGSRGYSKTPLLGVLERGGLLSDVTSDSLNYLIQVLYTSSLKLWWTYQQGLETVSPAVHK